MSFLRTDQSNKTHGIKLIILDIIIGLSIGGGIAYWGHFEDAIGYTNRLQYQIEDILKVKAKKIGKLSSNQIANEKLLSNKPIKLEKTSFFVKAEDALKWLDELFESKAVRVTYTSINKSDREEFYDLLQIVLRWTLRLEDSLELVEDLSSRFKVKVNTINKDLNSDDLYSVTIELNTINYEEGGPVEMESILAKYGLPKSPL